MASGYVKKIREKIGHDSLLLTAAGIIIYQDRKVLLQRRADNGLWATHGGAVEPGENVEEAARRELLEETGLRAGRLMLYGIFSGEDYHCIYPNGDEACMVCIEYLCMDFTGEPAPDKSEVLELRWFPVNELPADMSPIDALLLENLPRRIGYAMRKEWRGHA